MGVDCDPLLHWRCPDLLLKRALSPFLRPWLGEVTKEKESWKDSHDQQ